ncbi:MAG: NAD(P)-dependent oxidoreductase [Pseudomonadota bacterium]
MNEKTVLFSEEDTLFSLMETGLNGKASPQAEKALHYFFGEKIEAQVDYLLSIPSQVGLPPGFRAKICKSERDLPTLIREADVLVCERTRIDGDLLKLGANRLRFIQKFGSDYENIDVGAAKALGIPVAYLKRISTRSVAEHIVTLVLVLSRNLILAHQAARDRKNAQDGLKSEGPPTTKFNWGSVPNIQIVQGKTLGLVGFGENALETAKLACGLGMRVLYYKRNRADQEREKIVDARYVPTLKQLVQEADFTSIHAPYGPPTEKMFNREILSGMKPTSFLISGSRGGIVDEQALFDILKEKKIAGAALDVYRWEPVPSDCPLLDLDNVVWATHNGGGAPEFMLQESRDVLANIARVERGERPEFLIE